MIDMSSLGNPGRRAQMGYGMARFKGRRHRTDGETQLFQHVQPGTHDTKKVLQPIIGWVQYDSMLKLVRHHQGAGR